MTAGSAPDRGPDASWVDSMPEVYDRALGPALFQPFAEHLAPLVAAVAPRQVLELAAGSGIATASLVRALPDADITATDLNPSMVEWARARVPGATWRQADAQQLDFPDGSFDVVLCQFGAMFFPDKVTAFAEAARVLRPGGTLLLAVWDELPTNTFDAAMVASLQSVLGEEAPDFLGRVPHGYADAAVIRADLQAAGLRDLSVDRVVLQGKAASAALLAEGFCLGTPLRFPLERLGDLAALSHRLAEELEARLGAGPLTGEIAALVVSARP